MDVAGSSPSNGPSIHECLPSDPLGCCSVTLSYVTGGAFTLREVHYITGGALQTEVVIIVEYSTM